MIEVRWDFKGDEREHAVHTAVEKVVRRLQRTIRTIVCPIHRRPPALRVRGHNLCTLDIGFETCCGALKKETSSRVHDIRSRARSQMVEA
jgi:hypothetical protein